MDDENMDIGMNMDAAITESPTETVRPVPRRNGLAQQTKHKALVLDDEEEVVEEEEETIRAETEENDNGDYGVAYEDDSYDQNDQMEDMPEPHYGNDQPSEEEQVEELATPSPVQKGRRTKTTQKSTVPSRAKKPKQPSSSQPAAKRPRTTPKASQSIIERKEYPHPADVSTMDGDGTLPRLLSC
jgi:hypothetical protein